MQADIGFKGVNWIGLWTLYAKEVERFFKVAGQTVLAPMASAALFLAVFSLALGGDTLRFGGVPFVDFLAPGLIMMAVAQNAFANTASSLIIAKMGGTIVDVLMPPLSADEFLIGYALAGVTRGIVVALAVGLSLAPFAPLGMAHAGALLFFLFFGALLLSLAGVLTGILGNTFDRVAAVTNFLVSPLALLSGTFYSIERLPEVWQTVIAFNPLFYMIDGFRFGSIGIADGPVLLAAGGLLLWTGALWLLCRLLIANGVGLKT
jgi:ABC-2 type transport system permease protein